MRYRLRTLLIVLALGPPLLAGVWLILPVLRAAILAFTIRDMLWLALIAGISLGWWAKQQRSARRIDALAKRVHQLRD